MRHFIFILFSVFFATITSCGSSGSEIVSNSLEESTLSEASSVTTTQVKFEPFNNIDDVRQKLSGVGIGGLGKWRDNGMGGFMSITSYHEFGGGNLPNYLAYYLESDNSNSIKTLKLVLDINNGNKKPALSKFAETVDKTYKALGLTSTNQIMNAAKDGKEVKVDKDTHTERIELEKSRIETWKFIIEAK